MNKKSKISKFFHIYLEEAAPAEDIKGLADVTLALMGLGKPAGIDDFGPLSADYLTAAAAAAPIPNCLVLCFALFNLLKRIEFLSAELPPPESSDPIDL